MEAVPIRWKSQNFPVAIPRVKTKKTAPDPIPEIQVVETEPSADDYLISLPEACKFLDISDATIRRYIKAGKIPAYNFGKEYKFKISELTDFVDSNRVNGKSESRKTG